MTCWTPGPDSHQLWLKVCPVSVLKGHFDQLQWQTQQSMVSI